MNYKKLIFIFLFLPVFINLQLFAADINTKSPDGKTKLKVFMLKGQVYYNVRFMGKMVIESSPMNMIVDGNNLTANTELGKTENSSFKEEYPTRGIHAVAKNHFNGSKISITSHSSFIIDT